MTRWMLGHASAVASLVLSCACSSLGNCPQAREDVTIETGSTDLTTLTYESAPWNGPLDAFPAKTKLHFKHGLGVPPLVVQSYLAFKSGGTHDASDVTENAGNQGRIDCVDDEEIVIRNDTCEEDFFIRVVATAAGSGAAAPACQQNEP